MKHNDWDDEFNPCPACKSGLKVFGGTSDTRIFHCGSKFEARANILRQSALCKELEAVGRQAIGLAIIPYGEE